MKGKWVTGFLNYEYRVNTAGYFGLRRYYENPGDQRNYELNNEKQSKPRPIPTIKSVLDFHTPTDFGPSIKGHSPFGSWHMNIVSRWSAGSWFTYNPNNIPGIEYNVQYVNNYNIDLKFSKIFSAGRIRVKFYADIYNALNSKFFSGFGFEDGFDYNYYMQSLHLPEKIAKELGYNYFPGDDKPGDFEKAVLILFPWNGYQILTFLTNLMKDQFITIIEQVIFISGLHLLVGENVDKSYYESVLKNKQYIDMPNQSYYVFLNPRDIFFGLNISYDF